jgi:hypothetical protein
MIKVTMTTYPEGYFVEVSSVDEKAGEEITIVNHLYSKSDWRPEQAICNCVMQCYAHLREPHGTKT